MPPAIQQSKHGARGGGARSTPGSRPDTIHRVRGKPTTPAWELRALAFAVGAFGGDSARFLAELGIDDAALADAEARIPSSISAAAWELAPRLTGDENFGLHLARAWSVGAGDVLGNIACAPRRRSRPRWACCCGTQRVALKPPDLTIAERRRRRSSPPAALGRSGARAAVYVSEFMFAAARATGPHEHRSRLVAQRSPVRARAPDFHLGARRSVSAPLCCSVQMPR